MPAQRQRRVHLTIENTGDAGRRAELDRLVDAHLHAESQGDVETLLAGMTDDVEHEMLGAADNPARGKDAVRARYLERFANTASERDVPLRRLYGDGFVVDEMIWEGRVTGRLGPLVGAGRRVSHRVLHVFEVRDGRISLESVYPDTAAILRQLS
jgi:uncharacterized protein